MTTLLLFDIDGTLVQTGGAGARAMVRAFTDVCGFF
ncbi:MAG: HAD family hydrolase, partial [Vicinamibacterales bacterium]